MKNKIKKIQIFRIVTQIIFIFILPGLFIQTFSQIKNLYVMILNDKFNFMQAYPSFIELITIMLITIVIGRFFCGWFCAFGAFNDFLYIISKNIFKVKFKVDRKLDAVLKYLKYVILLVIVVLCWTMGSTIFQSASPWDAFAQITTFPQVIYSITFGFIILMLIAVGAMFIERFFCRYLCPLGAVFGVVSRVNLFKINKPKADCGKCRLCTNNCSMGLPLYKADAVRGGECINCLKCVETCPRSNTKACIANQQVNPALASTIAIAGFVTVYSVNNVAGTLINKNNLAVGSKISTSVSTQNQSSTTTNSNATSTQKATYKDGTYTGTADGFRPGLQVAVTIKNSKIANIEIVQINDTPRFYQNVINVVPNEIIQAQSTNVDTVSGATYSSRGIINATQAALDQAKA
jgi:NosR/NirI family nitrous oxide reductase transcriptional regulator